MVDVHILERVEPFAALELIHLAPVIYIQLVPPQNRKRPHALKGEHKLVFTPFVYRHPVPVEADRRAAPQAALPLVHDDLVEVRAVRIHRLFRPVPGVQRQHEALLVVVPLGHELKWEAEPHSAQPLIRPVAHAAPAALALYLVAMTLKLRQPAPGADVHRPLQIFRAPFGPELAVRNSLVHCEAGLYLLQQLLLAQFGKLLRLYHPGDIGPHFPPPDHIAPARVDAVAALYPEKRHGQLQYLRKRGYCRVHVARPAAVTAVPLRRYGYRPALLRHLDAVEHRRYIRGLLLYRYRRDQPAQQRGYPAVRKQVLTRHIVHRTLEGHAHKKLVKGRLVVHEYQIRPVPLRPEALYLYAVFYPRIRIHHRICDVSHDAVTVFQPRLLLFALFFFHHKRPPPSVLRLCAGPASMIFII